VAHHSHPGQHRAECSSILCRLVRSICAMPCHAMPCDAMRPTDRQTVLKTLRSALHCIALLREACSYSQLPRTREVTNRRVPSATEAAGRYTVSHHVPMYQSTNVRSVHGYSCTGTLAAAHSTGHCMQRSSSQVKQCGSTTAYFTQCMAPSNYLPYKYRSTLSYRMWRYSVRSAHACMRACVQSSRGSTRPSSRLSR
jgi:hypothetical protein